MLNICSNTELCLLVLRQGLTMEPTLIWSLPITHLNIPCPGIRGVHHHAWFKSPAFWNCWNFSSNTTCSTFAGSTLSLTMVWKHFLKAGAGNMEFQVTHCKSHVESNLHVDFHPRISYYLGNAAMILPISISPSILVVLQREESALIIFSAVFLSLVFI